MRILLAIAACIAVVALAGREAGAAEPRWELQTALDARDVWMRALPPIDLRSPFDAPNRTLPAGTLPSAGEHQFMALTWDSGITVNDRWLVPIFGVQFGWTVGTSPDVVTSLDGTIVHMQTWSADMVTLLLPGVGMRAKARRWLFSGAIRPVASFVWMDARAADGTDTSNLGDDHALFAMGLGVRAELEACRRSRSGAARVPRRVAVALRVLGVQRGIDWPEVGGGAMKSGWLFALALAASAFACGCGSQSDTVPHFGAVESPGASTPVPSRAGSVVVEGCQLDGWQSARLAAPSTKAVLQTVILLCPTARDDGTIAPVEASAQSELAAQIAQIKGMGYQARLALTMADELDQPYPADVMGKALASPDWRTAVAAAVGPFAAMSDGIDLQLPPPPDTSTNDVTSFVQALSGGVGRSSLGIFVPPGGASNDVAGAPAYDLSSIGPMVARVRVLTLDYSCCTGSPGPTIDSGWAVDVARAVAAETSAPIDLSVPLYGWDFGPQGQRSVGFFEAQSVAADTQANVQRGPTGTLFYDWQDDTGGAHETWFDDAASTSWTLAAWDTQTLPPGVGVVYWGLGSEDPALWDTLAREMSQ